MKAAHTPTQRPRDARLLVVDAAGHLHHAARSALPRFLQPGDLLVANDAATLPASLSGQHLRSGQPDAWSVIHGFGHISDQLLQTVIKNCHRTSNFMQPFVWIS